MWALHGGYFAKEMCPCPEKRYKLDDDMITSTQVCLEAPPAVPGMEMEPGEGMQCLICFASEGHMFW